MVEAKRPLHETMRLPEARFVRHALGGSMPSLALKHCKAQSRRDAPKRPSWKHRAPKMPQECLKVFRVSSKFSREWP